MDRKNRAVILFSGGLDSTTILYYALQQNYEIFPISYSYEQRHLVELKVAASHCQKLKLTNHRLINIDRSLFQGSALTNNIDVPKNGTRLNEENNIPVTYVPVRNLILLSLAGAYAESNNIDNIFIGVNAVDYSGYPDCRPEFIDSFQKTLNLASKVGQNGQEIKIHTPLISLTKKEIIEMGYKLKVPYELTWSCYDPIYEKSGDIIPCQKCDSCLLREAGFSQTGKKDPLKKINPGILNV